LNPGFREFSQCYELYVWDDTTQTSGREGRNEGIDFFKQVTDKDPTHASAYAGMAESYAMLVFNAPLPPNDTYPNAMAAAQRAVDLDDGFG
jgi:hypothetical protein